MDLLFMILLVISVFCIRLFASTNIEATSVIIKRKNLHTNTPVEKNRSCALLATNIDVTNMTDTCPYPELFSYETGTCEMFYLVDCSDREEPFTPCDYPNTNCSWEDPNNHSLCKCEPHHDLNYAFCHAFNKQDGLYHWPGRRWKPFYINCTSGRTFPGSCNEASAVFDYLQEECRSLDEALKNAYALSLMSQIPSSMLHLLTPFAPDLFSHKQSTERNSISSTVLMSSIMNSDQLSFSSEPYSASISFDQFHSDTLGTNTLPTSFVSNKHVTKSEKFPQQLLYSPDYIDSSTPIVESKVNNQYQSKTLRYTHTTPFVFRERRTINESLSKRVDDYDDISSEPETIVSPTKYSSWSLPNTIYQSQKRSPTIKPTPAILNDTDADINALISNSNEYFSPSFLASSVIYETEEKLDHSTCSEVYTSSKTLQNVWFVENSVTKLDDSSSVSLIATNTFEGSNTPVLTLSSFSKTYDTNEITDRASFVKTSSVMPTDINEQNYTSKPPSFTSSHQQQTAVENTELVKIRNTSLHSDGLINDMSEETVHKTAYPLLTTVVSHSSQSISSDSSIMFDNSAIYTLDINSLTTDLILSSTSSFTAKQSQDTSFFQISHLNTPSNLPVLSISDSDTSKNIFHFNSESIDSNTSVELGSQSASLHIPLTNVKLSSTISIQSSDPLSSQSNFDMSTFSNSARHLTSSKQTDKLSKATSISDLVPENVLSEFTTITTTILTTTRTQTNPIESIVSTLGINEEIIEFSNTYISFSISSKTHSTVDQIREQASLSPMFLTSIYSSSETPLKGINPSNRQYQLSSTRDADIITPSFTMHLPITRLQDLTFAPTPSAVSSSTSHDLHSVESSSSDIYPTLSSTGSFIGSSGTQSETIHATRNSDEQAVESTVEYVSGSIQFSYLLHSSHLISIKDFAMSTRSNSQLDSTLPITYMGHLTTQLSSSLANTSAFPGTKEAQRSDDKKSIGVLIGIIIGACVAFVLVVLIAVFLVRRASHNQKDDMNEMPPELATIETKPALHFVKKL